MFERTIPEITDERIATLLKTLVPVGIVKSTEQGGDNESEEG